MHNNQIERVCHYNKLFIDPSGYVFPCCISKIGPIGNIKDINIHDKIKNYYEECECYLFKNRKALPEDIINIKIIRATLLLECQASCIMCIANFHQGNILPDLYARLEEIIKYYKPQILDVTGGEVTIQKESLNWLEKLKEDYNITIKVISNGNLPLSMIDRIEKIFDTFAFSFVGFQPETYKTIMGIDINKTLAFANALIENKNINVQLKYLETPINIHEMPIFLEWAIKMKPQKIYLHNTIDILNYINLETTDNYWKEVIKKTGKLFKKVLIKHKTFLSNQKNYISINSTNANYYKIDKIFLEEHNLVNTININ